MRKSLCAIVAFAAQLLNVPAAAAAPEPSIPQLSADQWRQDLHFMATEMKQRHINLYHQVTQAQFDAAVVNLDRRIPLLQRNQIIVGMMRIAAMVGDGHTRIEPRKDKAFGFRSLPLSFYLFDDGLYIRAAAPSQRALVGARVEAIGGTPIADAIRRTAEIVSKETPSGPKLFVPLYLAMPDILQSLGLSDSRDSSTLTVLQNGRRRTVRVPVGDVAPLWPADTDISLVTPKDWVDARQAPQPLWLQDPLDAHRMAELPRQRAIYVQLNMVTDKKEESLSEFGARILAAARVRDPKSIIVDLRLDQGGNGDLRNEFVADLIRARDDDTRLIVLTGRGTFSASQFIIDDLTRLGDATIIGEPASSRPTGYGDAYKSLMPNSGIAVRSSIRYWQSGQDKRPFSPVEIAAPFTFADYVAGRDPGLDLALGFRPGRTLTDMVTAAAKNGPSATVAAAQTYVAESSHRYSDLAADLAAAEQTLLSNDQSAATLALARWSKGRFPASSDLETLHAYAADSQGLKSEAMDAVAKALAIDPNNRFAQSLKDKIAAN